MAVLRLSNGGDVVVKSTVSEAIAAMTLAAAPTDFIELPGEDGPIHIRPSSVLAIIEDTRRGVAGFRAAASDSA